MASGGELDRRTFLVAASVTGGGLALGFAIPFGCPFRRRPARAAGADADVTCWVDIAPDNTVTIRVARAEMGQGALTGLAMLVAEELECDWATVKTEFVSATENLRRNQIWGDTSTGASRSIASSQDYLRRAGATAREMLIAAAAARWRVPRGAMCRAKQHDRAHAERPHADASAPSPRPRPKSSRRPTSKVEAAAAPGSSSARRAIVSTSSTRSRPQPVYAIDVRLPNMLYAAIAQCPVFGGALKSVDEASIAGMAGVRGVVRMPDAVAVVADSWWRAKRAVDALRVEWDDRGNEQVSSASIAQTVRAGLAAAAAQVGRVHGDAAAALGRAVRRVEAEYTVPFLAHATMEPQTCTAHVTSERRRDLGADPGAGDCTGDCGDRRRRAERQSHGAPDDARRRLRPARADPGICPPGRRHRQGIRGASQARLVARTGRRARSLSALRHGAARRRP